MRAVVDLGSSSSDEGPRRRLSKDARREQLLDAATDLVVEQGVQALTMERLAERAGVSKALPYSHFENSNAVLIDIYQRETRGLAARVSEALDARGEADPVEVTVRTYFRAIQERGAILAIVAMPGSAIAAMAEPEARAGEEFAASMLTAHFGVPARRARLIGGLFLAALMGSVEAWTSGIGSRSAVEKATIEFLRGGIDQSA